MGCLKCLTTSAFRAAKTFFDHSVDWFYWFSLMEPIIYYSRIVRFLRLPEIVKPPLMHVCERPHQRAAEVCVTWHSLGDLLEKLTLWPKSSAASRPAQDDRLHGGAFLGPRWTSVVNLSLCVRFKLQEIKSHDFICCRMTFYYGLATCLPVLIHVFVRHLGYMSDELLF